MSTETLSPPIAVRRLDLRILDLCLEHPERTAAVDASTSLTYGQLGQRARGLAFVLQQAGVEPGERVFLAPERSTEALVAWLGTWLAGAVVVPCPPRSLDEQLTALLEDCRPAAFYGDAAFHQKMRALRGIHDRFLTLGPDDILPPPVDGSWAPPTAEGDPQSTDAYIVYTSGTTGHPKGVVGNHGALHHYIHWHAAEFEVSPRDRFSQVAPFSFDFGIKEFLIPLSRGASVHFVPEELRIQGDRLLRWLGQHRVTACCCLPLAFRELTSSLAKLPPEERARAVEHLRVLFISGDTLHWDDVDQWRNLDLPEKDGREPVELVNLYGPTESTIIKAFHRLPSSAISSRQRDSQSVPVGRAISDTEILIVDPSGQPRPQGAIGEILIASPWLARYADPQLDEGRFFELEHQGKTTRAYRTGDLGRLDSEGLVEHMGRADRQVKIQGNRVELTGVEAILRRRAPVTVLAPQGIHGDRVLVCFVQTSEDEANLQGLKAWATEHLTAAEMPEDFIPLESFPRTANGKIDHRRLLSLYKKRAAKSKTSGDPERILQEILGIWAEVLGIEDVTPETNFFEVGGDSMMAISLLRRLRLHFQRHLLLNDLVEDMTPIGVSRHLGALLTQEGRSNTGSR